MSLLLALLLAYLLGSLPTAYLLVKWTRRVDIRTVGSGNVGATNAARAAGRGIGAAVFAIDALKGVVAARLIPVWVLGGFDPVLALCCGLAAIVGHNFPCSLGFQGGKGVATTIGVLAAVMPDVAAVIGLVWLAVFWLSRYVSVASMAAGFAIPLAQAARGQSPQAVILGGALAALILVRHQANLQRLRQGTEPRAGQRAH